MPEITGVRRFKHARERTRLASLKADILPGLIVATVTAGASIWLGAGDEGFNLSSVLIPAVLGAAALIGYWAIANALEFAWNFWRAGDWLAIADLETAARERDALVASKSEQITALENAERERQREPTDEDIIATLSDRTKELLQAFEKDFSRGWSANHVDPAVIGQLVEHNLVEMTEVDHKTLGQSSVIIPYIRLNSKGHQVLRRLNEIAPKKQ